MTREAHRYHTVFAPITLVEFLTKTNLLLAADVRSELQSMNKQLSKQSVGKSGDQNGGSGTRFH